MKNKILIICFLFRVVASAQIITTISGNGTLSHTGDGGAASSATLDYPMALTFDKDGNLYFSESGGCRIRKISPSGVITTIAGTGSCGYNGDGLSATATQLNNPTGLAIDSIGNLFISDDLNNRIRKIDITSGILTTISGNGIAGYTGDNGPASAGVLNSPFDICFDVYGNLYIADFDNEVIRKINKSGVITTYAGNGSTIFSGNGGPATAAGISGILGLCTDAIGNIYMAARGVTRVLKVDTAGILTSIAGTGLGYSTGDGGPATNAQLDPERLFFDDTGNLYISCIYKNCIRKIDTFGIIHHAVGKDSIGGYNGDGGSADTSEINEPQGIGFDKCGNLYVADWINNRIRKVTFYPTCDIALGSVTTRTDPTVSIYPNPASASLSINSNAGIRQILISNTIGQRIYHGVFNLEKAEVNLSDFPPGIYFVQVTDGEGNAFVKKILKE